MATEKITEQAFFKSLERLETLAKGTSESNLQKSQICTGSGNEPQSWTGGEKEKIGDDWDDSIGKDGTDYNGAKVRKSIAAKVMKGIALTPREVALLKGDMDSQIGEDDDADDKGPFEKKGEKDKKDDDKDDKKKGKDKAPPFAAGDEEEGAFGKSFGTIVGENETLQKGIEVSDFLLEFAKSFGAALAGLEQRVTANVVGNVGTLMAQQATEQQDFNKSLADAVVNIGHGLAGFMQQAASAAEAPAGPPRSQLRAVAGGGQQGVQVLAKSQQGGSLGNLSKAQILDHMSDLVEKGQCSPLDVIKFESTGDLSAPLQDRISKSLAASGQ